MAYTFLDLAMAALGAAPSPVTARELWDLAEAAGLPSKLASTGKTPYDSLSALMYVDSQENPKTGFLRVGRRPVRFWLKARPLPAGWNVTGAMDPAAQLEQPSTTAKTGNGWLEADLHPVLSYFAHASLGGVRTRTIRHAISTKKTYGEWVHPDLVGVRFPITALSDRTTVEFAATVGAPLLRLFSFELKRTVGFGNLREAFFQAVSNSSWAHEGYLVAAEWDFSAEFVDELTRLTQSFGIGAIHLNLQDATGSRVLLPARPRDELDWVTLDKLVAMNTDMAEFLNSVRIDFDAGKIHEHEYDSISRDVPSLLKTILSK